jgi:prepilin peptidase CpaA
MPPILIAAVVLIFPALMLTAAASDALTFRIPNWISLALIAAFPVAALVTGMSWSAAGLSLGVGAAALVIGMILWALHWIGGGDAKLFAAGALWMGWPTAVVFAVSGMIAGGVLALIVIGLRSPPVRAVLLLGPRWVARLTDPGEGIPYGIAICLGGLIGFAQSHYATTLGL